MKFIALTSKSDNARIHVNPEHVRYYYAEPGGRGTVLVFGKGDSTAVAEDIGDIAWQMNSSAEQYHRV